MNCRNNGCIGVALLISPEIRYKEHKININFKIKKYLEGNFLNNAFD